MLHTLPWRLAERGGLKEQQREIYSSSPVDLLPNQAKPEKPLL